MATGDKSLTSTCERYRTSYLKLHLRQVMPLTADMLLLYGWSQSIILPQLLKQ